MVKNGQDGWKVVGQNWQEMVEKLLKLVKTG
jgi:hypothetical protein